MGKILLADDHSVIRSALKLIIENNIAGAVVEEADNADTVLQKIQKSDYDLLILDINMPGINSVDLIAGIFAINAGARILIFSMNPVVPFEKIYLQLGAKGYLTKTSSHDAILNAIETVMAGDTYLPNNGDAISKSSEGDNPFSKLSAREFEIMIHVLRGETVKEIYRQTGLAVSTISTYKARIQQKLGVNNNMEMVALAKAYNIINE